MFNSKPWASKFSPRGGQSPPPISARTAATRPVSPLPLSRSAKSIASQAEADMSRQVAEWDAHMDDLDKQKEKLLSDQWQLQRTQIGSLMGALAEMRMELAAVKEEASKEHIETAIQELLANMDAHGQAHSSIAERVSYLEEFIGESADKHTSLNGEHDALKTMMEARLVHLEGLIGDSADKHSKELFCQMQDLHAAIASCAKSEHASGIEKRVGYLETYLGESSDKHDNLKTTVETRLEHLEKLLCDSTGSLSTEIMEAQKKLKDLHTDVGSCASAEHHTNLEKRLGFLEQELGESGDKHDKHRTSLEERMEFLERRLGDSAEKHWKEIEMANAKLGDIHQALSLCAKQEHHSNLEQRVGFLETEVGQSTEKHDEHRTSMEERVEYLEILLEESSGKHWGEIETAKAKLDDIHKSLSHCAKQEHHSSLEQRIIFLEQEFGESADKHYEHKASMEERMEFLEEQMGDSVDKHWKEIQAAKAQLGDVHQAVSQCAKQEHHSSLQKRLEFLEKELGESADNQDKHKTSMEERIGFLEIKVGDSGEKHWKEIEVAKAKLGDIHETISQCAKREDHSNLEKRLALLEEECGKSVDKHDKRNTSMEHRMEYLETFVGDSAEKHWKEIEAAKVKLGDIHQAVSQCAKHELHIGLEERVAFLEQECGQSADKHDEYKTSIEERMKFLEVTIGDSAEKHWKEIEVARAKLGDVQKAISQCSKHEHHGSLEKRVAFLEQESGESVGKRDEHTSSMEERMEFLETKMGDSAEKHWKEIQAAKAKLVDIHKALSQCAKQEHHGSLEKRLVSFEVECGESFDKHDKHRTSIEERLQFLEARLGDSAEKHWKEIQASKEKLGDIDRAVSQAAKQEHASSLDKRLAFIENLVGDNADKHTKDLQDHRSLLGDSADKHWKEIDAAKKKLVSVEAAVSKCAKVEHHYNLEQRVAYLEKGLGDSADNHAMHKNSVEGRLEGVERKLKELGIGLDSKGHKSEIEKLEGIVLVGIDKRLTSMEEKHMQDFSQRLTDYEKKHLNEFEHMNARLADLDQALKTCANIDHYLGLDQKHGALSMKQSEITEAVKGKMQDVDGKIGAQRASLENMKMLLEQRLGLLETRLAEGFRGNEVLRDMESRFFQLQEDQKRARDVLESALQEQIRLEHSAVYTQTHQIKEQWEREVRARQAYHENYKELLVQERSARETTDTHIARRLEMFERGIYSELQRVWQEVQREPAPIIVQRSQPPKILKEIVIPSVMSPRMQPVNVSPLPSYVSNASIATAMPSAGNVTCEAPATTLAYEAPVTAVAYETPVPAVAIESPLSVSRRSSIGSVRA